MGSYGVDPRANNPGHCIITKSSHQYLAAGSNGFNTMALNIG